MIKADLMGVGLVLALLVSAPLASAAEPVAVRITQFAFVPAHLVVAPGTTVTWTNEDGAQHTVTGAGFASARLAKGESFSHVFTQPGEMAYHCEVHPYMTADVSVK
jgi:plastocyanin